MLLNMKKKLHTQQKGGNSFEAIVQQEICIRVFIALNSCIHSLFWDRKKSKKVSRHKLYLVLVLVPRNDASVVPDFNGCNVLCGCVVCDNLWCVLKWLWNNRCRQVMCWLLREATRRIWSHWHDWTNRTRRHLILMPILLNSLSLHEQIIYAPYILCRPKYFMNLYYFVIFCEWMEDGSLEKFFDPTEFVASNRVPLIIDVTHPLVCKKRKRKSTVMHFGKMHDINVNIEVFFLAVVVSFWKQSFPGKPNTPVKKKCTNKFSNDCI